MEFSLNYEKIYFDAVSKFKQQTIGDSEYTEKHHIIPRYAGGSDDYENLVMVTYRQHIFLHRVLFAWKGNPQVDLAIRLMTSMDVNKKKLICSMAGKVGGRKNAESGHMSRIGKLYGKKNGTRSVENGRLDNIRHLAHNEAQKKHLKLLCKKNVESGHLDRVRGLAHQAMMDKVWTDSEREACRNRMYKRCENPEYIEKLKEYSKISSEKRTQQSLTRSEEILNGRTFEEYLHMTPKRRSKYIFKTPNGLEFKSPQQMALYFGVEDKQGMIESWCRNFKNGWSVELNSV